MKRQVFRCVTALVLLGVLSWGHAAAPADGKAPSTDDLRRWIQELDHDRFEVREAASLKLLQAGKPAIESLALAADSKSPEVVDRVMRILRDQSLSQEAEVADATQAALQKLASSDRPAAATARAILREPIVRVVGELERTGARSRIENDKVVAVNFDSARVTADSLRLLRKLPDLESVSLSNPLVGDAELAELKDLPKLRYLNLFASGIGDAGLKHLKNLPALREVPMGKTRVTDLGLVYLKDLTQLEYLGLRGNRVTDAGVVHLQNLTNLTGLYLGETQVTDAGLVHLRRMANMKWLRLHNMDVSDTGLEHLKAMTGLQQLDLWDTKTTEAGRNKLEKLLPALRIVWKDH